jgi:hypothetical protein
MVTSTPNQQHVFYRGADRSIQHIFWDAGEAPGMLHADTWTRPTPPRVVGSPATMVTATPNQQHVFHRGTDGSIRHIFWDARGPAGTPYLHRDDWTGVAHAPPAAGDPVTMVTATPNQQHVFYRGGDGSIQHIFWDANEAPGALHADNWTDLPDQVAMTAADWFTPYRKIWQDTNDMDLGAGGVMLIPNTNFLVASGKEAILYVLDRNNLGKFDDTPHVDQCPAVFDDERSRDHLVQKFRVGINRYFAPDYLRPCGPSPSGDWILWPHVHGTPVFGQLAGAGAFAYVWPEKDHLKSLRWLGNQFEESPRDAVNRAGQKILAPPWKKDHKNPDIFGQVGMPGGMLTLGVDPMLPGAGVLFASVQTCGDDHSWHECLDPCHDGETWQACVQRTTNFCGTAEDYDHCVHQRFGMLYAFDPVSMRELWNDQNDQNDQRDPNIKYDFAKFVPPTIAKQKVILATMAIWDTKLTPPKFFYGVRVYGKP